MLEELIFTSVQGIHTANITLDNGMWVSIRQFADHYQVSSPVGMLPSLCKTERDLMTLLLGLAKR